MCICHKRIGSNFKWNSFSWNEKVFFYFLLFVSHMREIEIKFIEFHFAIVAGIWEMKAHWICSFPHRHYHKMFNHQIFIFFANIWSSFFWCSMHANLTDWDFLLTFFWIRNCFCLMINFFNMFDALDILLRCDSIILIGILN